MIFPFKNYMKVGVLIETLFFMFEMFSR